MDNWQNYTGCRALSNEEIDRIHASFYGKYQLRDRAIFLVGVYTGFRISEILSLRAIDVIEEQVEGNRIRNFITVEKGFMKGRRESRTIPLHERTRSAISNLIESIPSQWENNSLPLFRCQGTSKRLSARMYSIQLKRAASAAGISCERLSSHSMRKSFASRLYPIIGKDLVKMAQLLGHKDIKNTMRYIQFLDNSLTEAVLSV